MSTPSKVSGLSLTMLKGDTLQESSVMSIDGNMALLNKEVLLAKQPVKDLVDIDYNQADNILYFMFDDGSIYDVIMSPLSAFGRGPRGKRGENGRRGDDGKPGRPGPDGDSGCPGMPGVIGKPGFVGEKGPKGQTGDKGVTGPRGPIGLPGPKGYRGYPNNDPNDPCATVIDPLSVGFPGEDGIDGRDVYHFSFCRESEPPTNMGPYTVWGEITCPEPDCPPLPESDPLCEQRVTTQCPPTTLECCATQPPPPLQ